MHSETRRSSYRIQPSGIWRTVRQLYESGRSPSELCQQFGIRRSTFFSRRRREGWVNGNQESRHFSGKNQPISIDQENGALEGRTHCIEAQIHGQKVSSRIPQELLLPETQPAASPDPDPEYESIALAITDDHLRMAQQIRFRIEGLTADERLGAGPQGRQSRAAVDLATALEKVQKVERMALGLDKRDKPASVNAVIIVPPKMTETEWEQMASSAGMDRIEHQGES